MSDKEKYMQNLWNKSDSNDGVMHHTIMDMAWSLHIIAEMMMELNRYAEPADYVNGEENE